MAEIVRTAEADREITASRVFDAPRELVFTMWTDPRHIARWWGPRGFTTTIHSMDVRPGGRWSFILHGPDGTEYRNEIVYDVVAPPERLVYTHLSGPRFRATVEFAEQDGGTRVDVLMVFDTVAERDQTIKTFNALEGLHQTLGRLNDELVRFRVKEDI